MICQYDFIPKGNTCKILPTLDYEDRIWWLLLSFRSRMWVKQTTSSHNSEVAAGLPCMGHLQPLGCLLEHLATWKRLKCGNCNGVGQSQSSEAKLGSRVAPALPSLYAQPRVGCAVWALSLRRQNPSTVLLEFSELLWQPEWPAGAQLTMATTPWSRDNQHQQPARMTFYKSRYFQLADIWHWFINPAAGTILLSCVDKNLASPIKDWFVSWEKIIYCFHIIASAILG